MTLFDSYTLGEVELNNRVGLAPMTRVSATEDGRATAAMAHYYRKFAAGDFGFVVTEGVYPDDAYAQGYLNQPGLATDEQAESWEQVVDAVHEAGAPIFAQLMHAGAQTQGNPHTDGETLGPSAVAPKGEMAEAYGGSGEFATPTAATDADLEEAREGFVAAAERARDAGFDGVEIHGANGYLLNEFLSTYFNERDDEYGGAPENRVRFPAEVVAAVDEATPEGFVVGIRVSQTAVSDDEYAWPEGEDAAAVFFEELSAAGADYLHVTEGDATAPTFDSGLTLAGAAAEYADDGTTVIDNGGLGDPAAAEEKLDAGADLVTLGTSALANPDWPARVREDEDLTAFDPVEFLVPTAEHADHEVPAADAASDD
ncbi:NADH:flavin oxidoreductase [Halolamina salifodinae]|uniref:2,4-dienoyl-CoA reductase-like NADH-dependent reductase (Old Yellow Enzyme family) n=1 Tax=Halolamina salifodinae TaxID=1202767 RepID=A0A8T4GXN0_9EURY|nr:NADH:flavin oxidoreductase [Halolamina salifodinae]MBP1987739.1 2,4-dienoyl-CoA reductase-like NADH-dependent reductase (Old Yellow Enzyme family) [Halolamina salifodinae]